jgi:serine/threonine-protein kinase
VLGTTDYVSPEQALGQDVTGQSDLYSLGIVLYEMVTGEVPFKGENQVAVAMKHVREEIPDVQVRRPEVSSALAAVIDTATSKRRQDRYADDAELIADLEDVLAIEAARAGGATGEATSVLRTLPSRARRRIPFRVRHRAVAVILLLVVAAAAVGGVVWLATRTHHGTGNLNVKAPSSSSSGSTPLHQVRLCQSCASGFNPLSTPTNEHPDASLAIDNQVGTAWTTQTYYNGTLNKAGTGLYVDARPMTSARVLRIFTTTPGFTATIYARKDQPPLTWPDSGWVKISAPTVVSHKQDIQLTGSDTKYRFYLVWITSLGAHPSLALDEVTLYR